MYESLSPEIPMRGYLHGYKGLLLGRSVSVTEEVRRHAGRLLEFGGSPIGNSRVKLTNAADCVKRRLVREGENPVEVAANRLLSDGVTILHTIGGDDTCSMAAEILSHLASRGSSVTVVGLPKTVDNDVAPIALSLGATTAAEQGAIFFENLANENTTSSRQLIVHEVMGRHCGWLAAATARDFRQRLGRKEFLPEFLVSRERWDVDAVYIPELPIDLEREATRLRKRMDEKDGVNIFLSEGAGIETIVAEMEKEGVAVERDAFGHVRLDTINPGEWYAARFSRALGAEKVLVQKSGYFARSAAPNVAELGLIRDSAALAAECALAGRSGVVGMDEENGRVLSLISFDRIRGRRPFDPATPWFQEMLRDIGQG